ncbi:Ig-like domain-containing protein, partial [Chryseolinea sp. H1M3-3]|uniref:Ig-like domain-containing protein n=1 Tax=Chryseolinea sp. H1M3-3 TaxID=3034144 RepID=UPI0023EBAEA5
MLFFRQTLLSVCLILPCAFAYAQPTAGDDAPPAAINEGDVVVIDIIANDSPGSGFVLDLTSVDLDASTLGNNHSVTTSDGTFVYDGGGNVTFTPLPDFFGTATIQYTIQDTEPQISAPASITILVNNFNDPPTITGPSPSTHTINEGGSTGALTFTVGDIDNAVNTLNVTASSSDETLIPLTGILISGTGASRTVTVTPAANLSGGPVTITLEVSDGADSNTASFTVTVNAINDAPTITGPSPSTQTINEGGS